MKKILAVLLCVALFSAFIPAASAAESTDVTIHTTFFDGVLTGSDLQFSMKADYSWFHHPSSEYNHKLAQLSLMLATSAFNKETLNLTEKDANLRSFFNESGFSGYESYDYQLIQNKDTIANGLAYKKLQDTEGEYILLAVPICGQGYGDEWVSNFTTGNEEDHYGFRSAAEKVYSRLTDYISRHFSDERIKIWITGFSRSAAVGNILSHLILSSGQFEQDNVFAYLFAAPNTTKEPVAYPQVFNICNGFDAIPKVPFAEWKYGKFGITLYLPNQSTAENYFEIAEPAQKLYKEITGRPDGTIQLPERNWLLGKLLSIACRYIPSTEVYSQGYQQAISAAWVTPGSIADKLNVLLEAAEIYDIDTSGFENIREELMSIITTSLDYSTDVVTHAAEESIWTEIFSSGKELVHEHLPLVYLAWIFSTDDASELFQNNVYYRRISFPGHADAVILRKNPETDEFETIQDSSKGIHRIPLIEVAYTTYADLPATGTYKIILTQKTEDMPLSVTFSPSRLPDVDPPVFTTNDVTVYNHEFIEVYVPKNGNSEKDISVKLSGTVQLPLHKTDNNTLSQKNWNPEEAGSFLTLLSDLLGSLPDLLCLIILLVVGLFILIKRLIRGPVNDLRECRTLGKVLLILVAVVSLMEVLLLGIIIFFVILDSSMTLSSRMFQRISEILDLSLLVYLLFLVILQVLIMVLAIRGIKHRISRRRLLILSIICLVLNFISYLLSLPFSNGDASLFLYLFGPALSIIAVILADIEVKKKESSALEAEEPET